MANSPGSSITIRPLGQMVQAMQRYGQRLYQAPSDSIRGLDANDWYSPLQPVQPIAPAGIEPRGFQFWAGQNLIWTPRADAEYSAAQLKQLSQYPLARICIENVKDAIAKLSWEIQARRQPGETRKQAKKRSMGDDDLVKLNRFFEKPDREHTWDDWLRPLFEDLLVIDAPAILIRKTFGGEIVELPVLRGESIVRYIDENGFTPMPPSPAYAQNWWGVPLVNLTTDQLIYKPRNIVPRNTIASQLYGMPPTEQLAPEIQVGIKRLEFVMAYYTEGSIPGVVQVVPPGVTPDKIAEAMAWMNSELAGNLAARRQWRMVQGFKKEGDDQIEFAKETLLSDPYDDLHIRKIAFGYGTSAQRLLKQMNRASAQQADDSADVEGTLPWAKWLTNSVMNYIIQELFKHPDYEFTMQVFEEPDQQKQAETITTLVSKAQLTPNEGRERLGEEEDPSPEANMLGVITGTGFIPLSMSTATAGAEIDGSGNITITPKETPNAAPGVANGGDPGDPAKPKPAAAAKEKVVIGKSALGKGWVTVNGNHIYIGDQLEGHGTGGGHQEPAAPAKEVKSGSRLETSPIERTEPLTTDHDHISETKLVHFEDGSKAVFKPSSGESVGAEGEEVRSNVSDGYQTAREVGAWRVAELGGAEDLVTPAVERTIDDEPGVLMEFKEGSIAAEVNYDKRWDGVDLKRAAAFDYVIGNEDRHMGNWLVGEDGKLALIDHNLAFPDKGEFGEGNGNYRFIRQAADLKSQPKTVAKLYVKNKAKILKALKKVGLPKSSIDGVAERIDLIGKEKSWEHLYATVTSHG